MNRSERAQAAVELLRHAMQTDSVDGVALMAAIIEQERLWQECGTDAGEPIRSMREFVVEMNREVDEHGRSGRSPSASARSSIRKNQQIARQRALERAVDDKIALLDAALGHSR